MEIPHETSEKLRLLQDLCPGFRDYDSVDHRKNSDIRFREVLTERLTSLRNRINHTLSLLEDEKESETFANVQLLHNDLYRIIHRLRFTSYGNTRFFTDLVLTEEERDNLYEWDLTLLKAHESMGEQLDHLDASVQKHGSVLPDVRMELFWIQEMDEVLDLRARLILHRKRKSEM